SRTIRVFLYCARALRALHSFPTRRSSDLVLHAECARMGGVLQNVLSEQGRVLRWRAFLRNYHHVDILAQVQPRKPPDVYQPAVLDRKSTRLNSSHVKISYAVFCLEKKKIH